MSFNIQNSILQEISLPFFEQRSIKLLVKRDDLIHPLVSGNKWRKLKYNIYKAQQNRNQTIITFGGAYSNHLLATAAACKELNMGCVGIVRGDELNKNSNPTLSKCAALNMELLFVSRLVYALKNENDYFKELKNRFPNSYIIPEGGNNYLGMVGCQEIMSEIDEEIDFVCLAAGTATTAAGLNLSLFHRTKLLVVPVLKGFFVKQEIENLYNKEYIEYELVKERMENIIELNQYHFGGYGKYDNVLLDFIVDVYNNTGLPLDPIYTGKAFFALLDWIEKNEISNKKILFIHTGGLQGAHTIGVKENIPFLKQFYFES